MAFKTFPKPGKTKRVKQNKKERSEFSEEVRREIVEHYFGLCGNCGRLGEHIHHVRTKGSGGRGVFTNGLLLCAGCHTRIHMQPEMMNFYKRAFAEKYGEQYFMDDIDKGEQPC